MSEPSSAGQLQRKREGIKVLLPQARQGALGEQHSLRRVTQIRKPCPSRWLPSSDRQVVARRSPPNGLASTGRLQNSGRSPSPKAQASATDRQEEVALRPSSRPRPSLILEKPPVGKWS